MRASPNRNRQVVAAVVGNALEWYDFIVYGFFSATIARLFFPAGDAYVSLLMSLATFGIGFFMRPLGGILLGLYADRKGRKSAMQMVVFLMTVAIAMIAFAPSYASIGIGAPLMIVVARMLQGFATGGEYASATAFLVESAPENRRGVYGSWQLVGQCIAVFAGAAMGAILTHYLSAEALISWGWRVPFAIGLLIGPVGMWMRKNMEETHAFVEESRHHDAKAVSLRAALQGNLRGVLVTMGQVINGTVAFYVVLVNMPGFAQKQLGLPADKVFLVQLLAVAVMCVIIPLAGALSDYVGRRPVLLGATVVFLALVYPLYVWLVSAPSLSRLLVVQLALCMVIGVIFGPMPTALAEQFPTRVRSTGLSVAYNVAVMLFGGFAPFIVTWLTKNTGSAIAPAWYLLFAAVLGVLAAFYLVEKKPGAIVDRTEGLNLVNGSK